MLQSFFPKQFDSTNFHRSSTSTNIPQVAIMFTTRFDSSQACAETSHEMIDLFIWWTVYFCSQSCLPQIDYLCYSLWMVCFAQSLFPFLNAHTGSINLTGSKNRPLSKIVKHLVLFTQQNTS